MESLILAGGCFWGVEELFRKEKGVHSTEVGYTGGHTPDPTYKTVSTGSTGHAEAIKVNFDPNLCSLKDLLLFFFSIHDPTTPNQQGNDKGSQYRSAIFYKSPKEKEVAQEVIQELETQKLWERKIATTLEPLTTFFSAEDYHQDYLQKNPGGYTCHWKRF